MQEARAKERMTLAEFYEDRFFSDPSQLLEYFASDIDTDIAQDYGINFSKTVGSISLTSSEKKIGRKQGLEVAGKFKGKTVIWAKAQDYTTREDDRISCPVITFKTHHNGGYSEVWVGFKALLDLYRSERGIEISAAEKQKRQSDYEKKQAKREALAEQQAKKDAAEAKRKAESVAADIALFDTLETASPKHKYALRKRLGSALFAADIRQGTDKHGTFLAILLQDIYGQPRGLQRIYEQKITLSDGTQTDKTFTWGMEMTGAFMVLGDLKSAIDKGQTLAFCEGFATGSSWSQATKTTTVVALNSGNLKEVVKLFHSWHPDVPKEIAADNDQWKCEEGKGNAGLLAALELIKLFPQIAAYYPNYSAANMDTDSKPTDWNDVHLQAAGGIRQIARMKRDARCRLKAEKSPWEFAIQKLRYTNEQGAERQARSAAACGMKLAPLHISTQQVLQTIVDAFSPGIDQREITSKIKSFCEWLAHKKVNEAKRLRGFTPEKTSQEHINYIRVKGQKVGNGQLILPKRVQRLIKTMSGVVIIKAPMGSGKTQRLIKPLLQSSQQSAYIAHRVSLVGNACNMLSSEEDRLFVDNYQHVTREFMPNVRHLGTCINSAFYTKFIPFMEGCTDLFIDEAKQTMAHITAGTIENPVPVFQHLGRMMNSVKRAVLCDADANDALIEFCELACPGQIIHVIEMEADCSDFEVNHTTSEMAYQSAIETAKAGRKVLVATDGAQSGADLAADIRRQVPEARVLNVMRDTRGDADVERFQNDPNREALNYDVVIYSPSISSGVSIEIGEYFDQHIGIFYGTISPTDAMQMLRRDRYARRFLVGFRPSNHMAETDRDRIIRGMMAAEKLADSDDESRWAMNDFDRAWSAFAASERKARNDFANNMLLMMIADGYKVSPAERNPFWEEAAVQSKKLAREALQDETRERILTADTPSEEEAQRLRRLDIISQDDAARLRRYQIEHELCSPVSAETIDFVNERGVSQVKRLERALASQEDANEYDRAMHTKGVSLSRRAHISAQKHIWSCVLDKTGIDLKTGEGEFSATEAAEAMKAALPDEAAIEMYNELGIGPYVDPQFSKRCPTKWVKAILENLGLTTQLKKVGRAKLRRHSLNPDSYVTMMGYIKRRQGAEISSLKVDITSDDNGPIASVTNQETHPQPPNHEPSIETDAYSLGGGAGCSVMYINNDTECAPPSGNEIFDASAVDVSGLAELLGKILLREGEQIPEASNADMQQLLIFMDFSELIQRSPDVLDRYPEVAWIKWRGAA